MYLVCLNFGTKVLAPKFTAEGKMKMIFKMKR